MAKNTNDVTGDKIITKGLLSKQGEANFEAIFGKPKKQTDWDENRMDIIGQNGPTGLHYQGEEHE
jgi:hypothetical protein